MNQPKDIHSTNWHSIVTAAQMCRVQRPPADAETITIPRTVFDDLIRVAESAARLQHAPRPPAEIVIHRQKDAFAATVFDPITAPFTVTEPTLFQALSAANAKLSSVIDEHLR